MATIWITYAWDDNKSGDIDFIAQELEQVGLNIKLDRWNIAAGKRLWDQIANFITSPNESDAWLLIATNNSLSSEPCKEECAYALDRALNVRGQDFPVIAMFLGPVDNDLIPPAIRTRLFVSITDPDWKERIISSTEGRSLKVTKEQIQPYRLCIHKNQPEPKSIAIEVRPRAGVWAPFIATIPADEKARVDPDIMIGPRDVPTRIGMLVSCGEGLSPDGKLYYMTSGNQATPTESYYIWCKELPSTLIFGVNGRAPQFTVNFGGSKTR